MKPVNDKRVIDITHIMITFCMALILMSIINLNIKIA